MTDARTPSELEDRAAAIEAELANRKTASEKAADRLLNPPLRNGREAGWQPLDPSKRSRKGGW